MKIFFNKFFKKYREITEKSKYRIGFSKDGFLFALFDNSTGEYHLYKLNEQWNLGSSVYIGVIDEKEVLKKNIIWDSINFVDEKTNCITIKQPETIVLSDGSKYTFSDEWQSKDKEGK